MKISTNTLSLFSLITLTAAQNVSVPATCEGGFQEGHDLVLYTVPYTYDQVMGIIGSYQNLTWSGNTPDTVTLNGSDNTVGTARTYDLAGAHVIETLLTYDSPPGGPYYENHNVALLAVPLPEDQGGNISVYFPYDATTVMSICDGKATIFNFTAVFCSTNVTAAQNVIHLLHSTDAETVGQFLGGENFTDCNALGGSSPSSSPSSMSTATSSSTSSATPASFTGAATTIHGDTFSLSFSAFWMALLGAMLW